MKENQHYILTQEAMDELTELVKELPYHKVISLLGKIQVINVPETKTEAKKEEK